MSDELAAAEARIKELEAALRNVLIACANPDTGKWCGYSVDVMMSGGLAEHWQDALDTLVDT